MTRLLVEPARTGRPVRYVTRPKTNDMAPPRQVRYAKPRRRRMPKPEKYTAPNRGEGTVRMFG